MEPYLYRKFHKRLFVWEENDAEIQIEQKG